LTLTADDVAMFYAIFTGAERVDWARYEAFRLAILEKGQTHGGAWANGHATDSHPERTPATHVDAD